MHDDDKILDFVDRCFSLVGQWEPDPFRNPTLNVLVGEAEEMCCLKDTLTP